MKKATMDIKLISNKFIEDRRGQNIVEFALVVILFFAIIFGIMEFGRAWFYSNHLVNSVRAAARYGAVLVLPDTATVADYNGDIQGYLTNEIGSFMPIDNDEILGSGVKFTHDNIDRLPGDKPEAGDTITVSVSYNFELLSGTLLRTFFGVGTQRAITRSASMRYEG